MSNDTSSTTAETTTQQPEPPQHEERAQEVDPLAVARELSAQRVAELRAASREADAAAQRLKSAAEKAREEEPSIGREVLGAVAWTAAATATLFLVTWGLNKLLVEGAEAAPKMKEGFPRGTQEAEYAQRTA